MVEARHSSEAAAANARADWAEAELARSQKALADAQERHRDANQLLRRLGDANATLRAELERARAGSRPQVPQICQFRKLEKVDLFRKSVFMFLAFVPN